MNFGPTTQRFLIALAVVALLFTIWRAAVFPIAEQQKAVERELEKSGQTASAR